MAFAAQATEWTAADGTNVGEYAPIYGYNNDVPQHNQMQYPAAELTGMAAGSEITAMTFYTSTPSSVNATGGTFKVSLANIDNVTPWTTDTWGGVSGDLLNVDVTTVVATVAPVADENGVWAITFDAPFTYTGAALLVDFESITEGTWVDTEFYGKEMGAYYVMSSYGYAGTKRAQTVLPKVTFTYEGGGSQEEGIANLSEANALEDNAEFTFDGDAVVTLFMNNYLFLRDESGYAQISGVVGTFENGQVLKQGWNATKTSIVDGWVKYIDAEGLSASDETNADLAAAQKLTGTPDESMLNAYVYVENVTISGGPFPGMPMRALPLPDGNSISITSTLWATSWPANGSKNIYGILCKTGDAISFNIASFEDYVEPTPTFIRGDVNNDGLVNITDVTVLIDYVLGGGADINLDAAECQIDGSINIGDVTALIDYVLGGTWND